MPFDDTLSRILVLIGLCGWLAMSVVTYRFLASIHPDDRDWVDRTRSRRIAWVIFSPLFALLMIGYFLVVLAGMLGRWMKDEILRHWSRTSVKAQNRRVAARRRRRAFLFDPSE